MLKVGQQAPLFEAESTMGTVRLRDYVGKRPVVLIFYPMDETPTCTAQLCAVRDSGALYAQHDAAVIGVNPGSLASHREFARKHRYDFPIVADTGQTIRRAYKVGKILGLFLQQRIVYVIGRDGRIAYARKGNPPTEEIIGVLERL